MSLVTIISATFNSEAYLEAALESVFAQTHKDFEFLIIDDGSTDKTVSILTKYSQLDKRLKFSVNERNRGTGFNFSKLLSQAQGEFIAGIGHDDIWDPGFLEVSIAILREQPDFIASFANLRIINAKGMIQPHADSPFRLDYAASLDRYELVCQLLRNNFLCAVSTVFRRSGIKDWNTLGDNDQLQDWETWLHLALQGRFAFIPETLVSYRIHGNNLSIRGHNALQAQTELALTRTSIIASKEFADFILSHEKPESLFKTAADCIAKTVNINESSDYYLLLYALKNHETRLRHLETYRSVMAMLYLYNGAISKSNRYLPAGDALSKCPELFWKGFEWRYLIDAGGSGCKPATSPFIQEKNILGLRIYKFLAKNHFVSKISFSYLGTARTVEHLIEKQISLTKAPLKTKTAYFLRWIGLGRLVKLIKTKFYL